MGHACNNQAEHNVYNIIQMACWCTLIYFVGYHNRKVQGHDLSRNHAPPSSQSHGALKAYWCTLIYFVGYARFRVISVMT